MCALSAAPALAPGLMVLHGDRPESLLALLIAWLRAHPLAPLEDEVVLVQSNGIAQWLKMTLAQGLDAGGLGVAAGLDVLLPARFLWRAYRAVLGAGAVPEQSPLDEVPLVWRLMRLLPGLTSQPEFAPLAGFLAHASAATSAGGPPDARRLHALAQAIAAQFDTYQVFRADWLADWAAGDDVLRRATGAPAEVPLGQRWQPALWRALLDDVAGTTGSRAAASSRATVHQRFVDALNAWPAGAALPAGLPRRVVVFGISALPGQALAALAALSRVAQVLLFVHNPSRHQWTDIVSDPDLLRSVYRRHAPHPRMPAGLSPEALHQYAHPLLAAWGRQGRDYLRLVDVLDQPDEYRAAWAGVGPGRIDLFSEGDCAPTLLRQLQDDVLELRPVAETRQTWGPVDPAQDTSVRFHVVHSPQREVEVLHDQLLARFYADPTLEARQVIVMLPDVATYAPHIEAVFGRFAPGTPGHIPYAVADRMQRGHAPLLVALELLLSLDDSRFTASEVLDLLDVQAVRARFGLAEALLPTVRGWIEGAGVRWGLHEAQRARHGLHAAGGANSWRFGLERMLLGFATGDGPAFDGIAPYADVAGLDAAALGPLAALLRALAAALDTLDTPAAPAEWARRLTALLERFFDAQTPREAVLLQRLQSALDTWLEQCQGAAFDEALPLSIVREAWLALAEPGGLDQRFMTGGVSFGTLMPMRAIPFRLVCLLGMSDGAFPRQTPATDFDLMREHPRGGDRSRREDDRYLLLEALVSAREQLYVSWVGRDQRDNTVRTPSVLIGQLRDHIAAGWRLAGADEDKDAGDPEKSPLLEALTTTHPLQPFSRRYFALADGENAAPTAIDGLYTYDHGWRAAHDGDLNATPASEVLPEALPDEPIDLATLSKFIAQPIAEFFARRLRVYLGELAEDTPVDEAFAVDGLLNWRLVQDAALALRPWCDGLGAHAAAGPALTARVQTVVEQLQAEGALPMAAFGTLARTALVKSVERLLGNYLEARASWPRVDDHAVPLRWKTDDGRLRVEDTLPPLRRRAAEAESAEGSQQGPQPGAHIVIAGGRLHKGDGIKWHHVVRHWPLHLASQFTAGPTHTLLVSESGTLPLPPLEPQAARAHFAALVDAWRAGMREPLPVACKTAFALLTNAKPHEEFDGGFARDGEVVKATLARAFADFAALEKARSADGAGLAEWAERLYAPLWRALGAPGREEKKPGDAAEGDRKAKGSGRSATKASAKKTKPAVADAPASAKATTRAAAQRQPSQGDE